MRKLLITGASGMVGYAVCKAAIERNYLVTGLARHDRHALPGMRFETIDLQYTDSLDSVFDQLKPDVVIHLSANTNQSECELNPESTRNLHVDASGLLAAASFKIGSKFIHISTEAVYGNLGLGLRKETDLCKPEGVYAITKKEGEIQVLAQHPEALILRVTPVGYAPNGTGKTLVEWLMGQLRSGQTITGYKDVHFTPVSSFSLARLIFDPRLDGVRGIYNWGNSEALSKYEFALLLASSIGYSTDSIRAGARHDSSPFYGGMSSHALSNLTGIPQPTTADLILDLKHNIMPV
jgi:dTDP-4-dehydrorhamnose reductase